MEVQEGQQKGGGAMKDKDMRVVAAVVVASLVVSLAGSASALEIRRYSGYYSGNGGEFSIFGTGYEANYHPDATYPDGGPREAFQSFCLEMTERFTIFPDSYTIDPHAIEGGGGPVQPDPISVGTAWLYREFSDGVLTGYSYSVGVAREASAAVLQETIWWLEHELPASHTLSTGANTFLSLAVAGTGLADAAALRANSLGQYGVAVMNFESFNGEDVLEDRQSMLVRVPDGGLTLVMLGIGVLGCVAMRRRLLK